MGDPLLASNVLGETFMDPQNSPAPADPEGGEMSNFAQPTGARQLFGPDFEPRERIYFPSLRLKDISLVPVTDREFWIRDQTGRYETGGRIGRAESMPNAEINVGSQIGRFASQMEEPVRRWLGTSLSLSDSRVVLFSMYDGVHGIWRKRFQEIDAISLAGNVPDVLFEIKVSFKGGARGAAAQQLAERAEVLSNLHPHIRCAVVYVSCNPRARADRNDLAVGEDLALDTSEFYRRIRGTTIPCVTLPLDPLLAFAERVGVGPQSQLIQTVRSEQARRRDSH